jgi:hypothetical protein
LLLYRLVGLGVELVGEFVVVRQGYFLNAEGLSSIAILMVRFQLTGAAQLGTLEQANLLEVNRILTILIIAPVLVLWAMLLLFGLRGGIGRIAAILHLTILTLPRCLFYVLMGLAEVVIEHRSTVLDLKWSFISPIAHIMIINIDGALFTNCQIYKNA